MQASQAAQTRNRVSQAKELQQRQRQVCLKLLLGMRDESCLFFTVVNGRDLTCDTASHHTVGVWAPAKRACLGPQSPAPYTGTLRPGTSYCTMSVAVGPLVGDVRLKVDSAMPKFTSVSPVLAATCWKHVRARVVG